MADPAPAPGWYPDPWQRAERRWHDGARWTEHTDGAATGSVPGGPFVTDEQPAATPTSTPTPTITPEAAMLLAGASSERTVSQSSGRATAALITAILGIPLVPIVLGVLALSEISGAAHHMRGTVKAWIAIGIGIANLVLLWVLLAVAVPAALDQARQLTGPNGLQAPAAAVEHARAIQAQATLRQAVNAMEVCAADWGNGTYGGCEARVGQLSPQLAAALERCGSAGGTCITVLADGAYVVRVTDSAATPTTWSEQHSPTGQVTPSCTGPACDATAAFA